MKNAKKLTAYIIWWAVGGSGLFVVNDIMLHGVMFCYLISLILSFTLSTFYVMNVITCDYPLIMQRITDRVVSSLQPGQISKS